MQVIPHGCTFIRGLINFSMMFRSDFACRHVPAYACSDLCWWSAYAMSWNGVQILEAPRDTLDIYMDASGSKGLGGIFVDQWYSSRCPHHFRSCDIQFKEVYVVLQVILRWGHLWWGHHIVFHIDNSSVVSAISSGTIQNSQVMNMLRWIVMLAAQLGFTYSSSGLASTQNSLADAASHFEYYHIFSLAPSMQKKPCTPH